MRNDPGEEALYADVIIDISHENVDRTFTYRIPRPLANAVTPGVCVQVPFGKGNTKRKAYVVSVGRALKPAGVAVKEIEGILTAERGVDDRMIRLAVWMRARYGSTLIAALKTVLPAHKKIGTKEQRQVALRLPEEEAARLLREWKTKRYVARARLLEALLEAPGHVLMYPLVTGKLQVSSSVIRALDEQGVTRTIREKAYRDPASEIAAKEAGTEEKTRPLRLSDEQTAIVTRVTEDLSAQKRGVYLIHGVTGSGKTEVYIRLIEETVKRGAQAIVLIPEIALTWQTLNRFYRHFGDRVSVMHSALSAGEKSDQFARAREGKIDVMIGPRSALFTPFANPGLIVIDEEHELTYKSETMPRYHARECAIEIAGMSDVPCAVVLGSATPSMESYTAARRGEITLFRLSGRLTGGQLAQTHIVDLREELKRGNRSVFSRLLCSMMEERLARGEQTMLFLNRRGLAGFISCRACGHVFTCPHCDVSLTEHAGGLLVCHYCGHTQPSSRKCPSCGKNYVSAFRAGTEMIEREVKKIFPEAAVLRMDADTTRRRHRYEEILSAFANREAQILVGTQMIVKGHDFPDVTLVGVLAADMSLNASDFRAAERTFQLITQAAGRAGRGVKKGDVVIQTYQPEHYSIRSAAAQDYEAFYAQEASYRTMLKYPPMAHMLSVLLVARREEVLTELGKSLRHRIEGMPVFLEAKEEPVLIGPAPAQIKKIDDYYRYALYIRHADLTLLCAIRDALDREELPQGVQMLTDTDPMRHT
ncbi:MAG: primosomal protein N' [Lachnospiraceae bacterium]|nr:primosomal protein N' [Lachnospiraceae bacterium]